MLAIDGIHAAYGEIEVLHGVSLEVPAGRSVGLLGLNGAGKSTLLAVIAGLHRASGGRMALGDEDVTRLDTAGRVRRGVALVPETRELFGGLSVHDNLRAGLIPQRLRRAEVQERIEAATELFPVLREKRDDAAGLLSGGQQQMLAIARALTVQPRLLLLDEPSLGLAPALVSEIYARLAEMRGSGVSILVVEQHVHELTNFCDHLYVLRLGEIIHSGKPGELGSDEEFARSYLGG